ncbi:MAG: glycosyltransferase [Clostridiales bacterium]|jgi:cellulose synthase/poly-beta-1,6-N-acetylglucosamine synthase-like glycosyltransferase|nr:glycosyltransferase [Clostridiales bacterium]
MGGVQVSDISIFSAVSYLVQILFLLLGAYYFVISIFSFIPRRESEPDDARFRNYALLVAAHNEELVIENMVDSLKRLDYPEENYEIFVIADNCSDRTAAIARGAGATVFERCDTRAAGKGFALEWMFDKIFKMDRKFDSVVVFDADNIADRDFLRQINRQHNKGARVVQGYIDSKNPGDSWISYSYSIAFWTVNRLFQQSRANLNLGCQLCGTGFSVDIDVLKDIGWGATCLTEDMEFTMKLALNDIKVGWANDAIVYDEKPLTLSQSWKQRVRWMQGHADVACRFIWKLAQKALSEKKLAPFDCAVYLLQPLRIITMGAITAMAWLQTAYPDSNLVIWGMVPSGVWNFIVILQFCWTPFVLIVEKKISKKTLWGYLAYTVYTLTWVPIAVVGVMNKNKKEWFHTQHTRKISINELQ